jgi:spore coat polysaccharide biosynthesis predicted glycosyltransferase SpsG
VSRSLLILTEGDRHRGLGHVTRCAAYAEGWIGRGGEVRWRLDGDGAARSVAGATGEVALGPWLDRIDTLAPADMAIVDSYRLTAPLARAVADRFEAVVFVDDLQAVTYPAATVVHPALDPAPAAPDAAEWLVGPRWQPLRPAFWTLPSRPPARDTIGRVLVTLGGGDTPGLGAEVAGAVRRLLPETRIDLVAGHAEVEAAADVTVHRGLSAEAMADLMLRADLAVSAAGTTVFELARCGTPTLMIGIADNQRPNLRYWPDAGGFVSLGRPDAGLGARLEAGVAALGSPQVRAAVSARAGALVDGQGVMRLFDHLRDPGSRS